MIFCITSHEYLITMANSTLINSKWHVSQNLKKVAKNKLHFHVLGGMWEAISAIPVSKTLLQAEGGGVLINTNFN